jgi:hypothetical protein
MHLRGHSGRICGCRHWLEFREGDAWVVGLLVWILLSTLVFSGVLRP